jgi:hypothetical protein
VVNAINIQPMWLMDEWVRIFCIEVWFNPPIDPTTAGIGIILSMKY